MNYEQLGWMLLSILGWSGGGILGITIARVAYNIITPFNATKELIEDRNAAVGVSDGAFMIASAIIMHGIIIGERISTNWAIEIGLSLGLYLLGFVLMWIGRMLLVSTTSYDFNRQIHVEDNIAVGLIEGAYYVAFAIVIHSAL